jgi:predicted dehydrogenase
MYREQELDAVVICTPHSLHAGQALEALEAGCHVLIEKPMVTTLADARSIEKRSAANPELLLGVCFNPAYSPALERARQAVRDRRYGGLELVHGYLSQDWYRLTDGTWRHDPAVSGGGQTMDSGAHLLNSLLSIVQSPVRTVYAVLSERERGIDINAALTVRFDNGVAASLAIGGNSPPDGGQTVLLFENGRIELDAWKGDWYRGIAADGTVDELLDLGEADPDGAFIDAIRGGGPLAAGLREGVDTAALTDAIYRSAASGTPESLA